MKAPAKEIEVGKKRDLKTRPWHIPVFRGWREENVAKETNKRPYSIVWRQYLTLESMGQIMCYMPYLVV